MTNKEADNLKPGDKIIASVKGQLITGKTIETTKNKYERHVTFEFTDGRRGQRILKKPAYILDIAHDN